MPSAEGRGRARAAWDAYQSGVKKIVDPVAEPLARRYGAGVITDLVGFWMLWHVYGGFDGLLNYGMPRTTIFRKVKRFRQLFGSHPDEHEFPGITIDVEAYWAGAAEAEVERKRKVAAMKASTD
jgi:hypothetical protein